MAEERIDYQKLLSIKDPSAVAGLVRKWASSLSDHEHLVRSTIQEIHLNVERRLKFILFEQMKPLVFRTSNDGEGGRQKKFDDLERAIDRLGFQQIYRLLAPCLTTFPADEFSDIAAINEVRNQSTHSDISKVIYKNGNPFTDPEKLANLFVDAWALGKQLDKFYECMIEEPIARHKALYQAYKDKTGESFI